MNSSTSPSPFLNLSAVISAVRGSLGGWSARGLLGQALMFLVYRRLAEISGQMERLAQRFQAGKLAQQSARPAVSRQSDAAADGARCFADKAILPRRFGWLVWCAAYQAAGYGCQLRAILETPEMVALLVAAPQAARILSPLCRMLAVETSLLRPLAKEAVTQGDGGVREAVVRKRVRPARDAIDWGRIPLPRGVLAAARRQGVRKSG